MDETKKYLVALMAAVFPDIRIGGDFGRSYDFIDNIVNDLRGLEHAGLIMESPADKYLSAFRMKSDYELIGTDWRIIFSNGLHLELISSMRDEAVKLNANGKWSRDELKSYLNRLTDYKMLTELRWNEFFVLYGHLVKIPVFPGIAKKLSKWITGATDGVLESIILKKETVNKPTWIGGQADAFRFMEWVGMTYPKDFTDCFSGIKLSVKNKPKDSSKPNRDSIYYVLEKIKKP